MHRMEGQRSKHRLRSLRAGQDEEHRLRSLRAGVEEHRRHGVRFQRDGEGDGVGAVQRQGGLQRNGLLGGLRRSHHLLDLAGVGVEGLPLAHPRWDSVAVAGVNRDERGVGRGLEKGLVRGEEGMGETRERAHVIPCR